MMHMDDETKKKSRKFFVFPQGLWKILKAKENFFVENENRISGEPFF